MAAAVEKAVEEVVAEAEAAEAEAAEAEAAEAEAAAAAAAATRTVPTHAAGWFVFFSAAVVPSLAFPVVVRCRHQTFRDASRKMICLDLSREFYADQKQCVASVSNNRSRRSIPNSVEQQNKSH